MRYQHDAIVVIIDYSLYGFEQYLLGPGYYTNPAQAPLSYNVLPDWNFDAFTQSLGVTQVATAATVTERAQRWWQGGPFRPSCMCLARTRLTTGHPP